MPLSLEAVSDLIGDLYSAAIDQTRLETTLCRLAQVAEVAGVCTVDTQPDRAKSITAAAGIDSSVIKSYNNYYHALDRAVPLCGAPPIALTRELTEILWPGFRESEFANEWALPNGVDEICVVTAGGHPRVSRSLILVARPGDAGFGGGSQLTLLRLLKPHIERMSALAAQMHQSEHRGRSFLEILECLPYGVIVLDCKRRVAHATTLAIDMIYPGKWINLSARGLRANELEVDRRLQAAITAALEVSKQSCSLITNLAIRIPRPTIGHPLVVHVMPLRSGLGPSSRDDDAAMVFICDPSRGVHHPCEILREAFELTRAETDVAVKVAAGHGLAMVATELGISVNTVRTHLQRVFQKTRTQRQTELGRLVGELSQIARPAMLASRKSDRK